MIQLKILLTHPLVPVTIRLRQETALKSKIKRIIYLLDVDPCLVNLGNWNILYNNKSTEICRHSFLMKTIIIDGYHFKLTFVDIVFTSYTTFKDMYFFLYSDDCCSIPSLNMWILIISVQILRRNTNYGEIYFQFAIYSFLPTNLLFSFRLNKTTNKIYIHHMP